MATHPPRPPTPEDAVRELEALHAIAPLGLAAFDLSLRYLRINERLAEINGVPAAGHLGRTVDEVVPDLAPQVRDVLARVLAGDEPVRGLEFVGETPLRPGVRRTWLTHWSPLRGAGGDVVGLVLAVEEVTDLRRAEQALRESEAHLRHTVDLNPQIPWTADAAGRMLEVSDRWLRMTGLTRAQALGEERIVVRHPDDHEPIERAWWHAVRTGEPYRVEYRARMVDGSFRWVRSTALPRRDADGAIVRWYGFTEDVDEARRAQDGLREADRRKDEFIAMLSHELRNPLAPLRTTLRLLDHETLTDRGRQALDIGTRQLRQIARLVDDLLEVSRISRGQIELRRESVIVQKAIWDVADGLASTFAERGLQLEFDVPPRPVTIDADPVRFAQIVENLLGNASKYTDRGGLIEVSVAAGPDEVEIAVRDSGIGFDPADLPRLFEPFVQTDAAIERSQGGLGIGLALVRRLVELHGGRVDAHSPGPGQGATFRAWFPREAAGG